MTRALDEVVPAVNVIIGPTAAGKSAIAMELARRFELSIVSADSRQIYRSFDIGTAKPTVTEQQELSHFGIDVREPTERYSAHAWAEDAARWIDESHSVNTPPLVVGGTGFYVRALVRPLAPMPALDAARRAKLEPWLGEQSIEMLRQWCLRLDPSRAHLGRTQLARAVETSLLAGKRLGDMHTEHELAEAERANGAGGQQPARGAIARAVRYLVVDPGAPLAQRIQNRVRDMVDRGWVDEVHALMATVPADAPAWLASGYNVMRQHAIGALSKTDAIERVIIETRQYAKRQRTWCRHQLTEGSVTRISPSEPHALDRAIAWLNGLESNVL